MKRIITSEIWTDKKWCESITNIRERYLWLYLLTAPRTQLIGIYHLPFSEIAYHTLLDESEIKMWLMDLTDKGLIEYDTDTSELLIYNYAKYNIYGEIKSVEYLIKRELMFVKSDMLLEKLAEKLTYNGEIDLVNIVRERCIKKRKVYKEKEITKVNEKKKEKEVLNINESACEEKISWDDLIAELTPKDNESEDDYL